MFNPLKYFRNRKVGLALGSGGSKGMAHIAVIEYLESMNIPIHMIAGSSIGAVIGALYCAGSMKKFKDDMSQMSRREMLSLFDPVLPRSGLMEGKDFIEFMKKYISPDVQIEELKIKLSILATDYYNGKSVVFNSGNVLEALRASVSIPGILVPVKYKGTFLIDGGVANPLPINVVRKMGAGVTIAVNLHPRLNTKRLKTYMKSTTEKGTVVNAKDIEIIMENEKLNESDKGNQRKWLKSIEHWLKLDKKDDNKAPNIFEIISQSFDIMEYMNTMLMLRYNSPTVLIEPNALEYGTLDFLEAPKIINEGHMACVKVRNKLRRKIGIWV